MARDPDAQYEEIYPGPPHRIAEGGHLWYVHPNTDERFLSVTSALDFMRKPDLDDRWRPRQSAKAAFRELPTLIGATLTPDCGQTYGKCSRIDTRTHDWRVTCALCACKRCQPCVEKYLEYEHYRESARHASRGSAAHHWNDLWVLNNGDVKLTWDMWRARLSIALKTNEQLKEREDEIRPYTESFLQFVTDYGLDPERWLMSEATVINREHMWGGTLDARIQFTHADSKKSLELCERLNHSHPVVSLDVKSKGKPGSSSFWPDNAKQLAAYRRGEMALLPDGSEEPLRLDDGGVILQVRTDGYALRVMVTDDATYQAFLHTLGNARWEIELGNEATLERAHPRQKLEGVKYPDPPKKRAPRKVAVPQMPSNRAGDLAAATGRTLVDVPLPLADVRPVASNATLDSMRARRNYPDDPEIPF